MVEFKCPACDRPLSVDEATLGKLVICPVCENHVSAPDAPLANDSRTLGNQVFWSVRFAAVVLSIIFGAALVATLAAMAFAKTSDAPRIFGKMTVYLGLPILSGAVVYFFTRERPQALKWSLLVVLLTVNVGVIGNAFRALRAEAERRPQTRAESLVIPATPATYSGPTWTPPSSDPVFSEPPAIPRRRSAASDRSYDRVHTQTPVVSASGRSFLEGRGRRQANSDGSSAEMKLRAETYVRMQQQWLDAQVRAQIERTRQIELENEGRKQEAAARLNELEMRRPSINYFHIETKVCIHGLEDCFQCIE